MDILRIAFSTDTHGGLTTSGLGESRLPRLVSAFRWARKGLPCILLDNGDTFFGGPLVDFLALRSSATNQVAAIIGSLHFDAVNVGNEDLRLGSARLMELAARFSIPLLSCNALRGSIPRSLVITRTLASRRSVKVGVVGWVAPSACRLAEEPVTLDQEAVATIVAELSRESDLVVVLAHTALDGDLQHSGDEVCALELSKIPGVSMVISGHRHHLAVRTPGGTLPVVSAGAMCSHLGVVEFVIGKDRPRLRRVSVIDTGRFSPDSEAAKVLAVGIKQFNRQGSRVLGYRSGGLLSEFAPWCRSDLLAWMEQAIHCWLRQRGFNDVTVATQLPVPAGPVSWVEIPDGLIRYNDLMKVAPFNNTLIYAVITGAALRDILEEGACVFAQLDPSTQADQEALSYYGNLFDFDFWSDLTWTIDLTAPKRARVSNVTRFGHPVMPTDRLRVVLSSYRAARFQQAGISLQNMRTIAPCVREVLSEGIELPLMPYQQRPVRFTLRGAHAVFRALAPPRSTPPAWVHTRSCHIGSLFEILE